MLLLMQLKRYYIGKLWNVVRPGGKLIASGILKENMKSPEKMLSSAGLTMEKTLIEDDWVTLVASIP